MKPIIEYESYRAYMQDFYDQRKRCSAFSWREFSRLAGFSSPIYLKLVCEGKSNLSQIGVERVAVAMGLAGYELVYFRSLVAFDQAKKDADKKRAYEGMMEIANAHKVRVLDSVAFAFYESWKNSVLRELAANMPGAKPSDLAHLCYQKISAEEVKDTLAFLVKAGLLKKTGENSYVQSEKSVKASGEAMPVAVRAMHRQMAEFAVKAVDEIPPTERNITGLTLGLTGRAYQRIVTELDSFRRKIIAIATEEDGMDQVYRLNLQLFPLTRNKREAV
ncbi:TIGR02147 family protein [uncultured Fibrobacter sp.]|uniref:TIGR02147 family protein n=1 Tax=uncultured Fibrobacter sp. TaxID=261512 RepID=UPI0025F746E1|nr:TIGR02147 family protein [uncultured Fibrobacter sp.]